MLIIVKSRKFKLHGHNAARRLVNLSMDEILIVGRGVLFDEVLRKYLAECHLSFA